MVDLTGFPKLEIEIQPPLASMNDLPKNPKGDGMVFYRVPLMVAGGTRSFRGISIIPRRQWDPSAAIILQSIFTVCVKIY